MSLKVVVTGGAGYIGSHVCTELLQAGHDVLVIDNFSNSHPRAISRVEEISKGTVTLVEGDLAIADDFQRLSDAVSAFKPDGAIHLAGLKAVGESVAEPDRYYRVNIGSALALIEMLKRANAKTIVFSSSATVYGDLNGSPVCEHGKTGATNPYGRTKLFIEEILKDIARADPQWRVANLRYFNPVGAHESGLIGEDPNGPPNNLFPYIAQVAISRRERLSIFGNDYPTKDGTGVRDYIHVCDLAAGHIAALSYLQGQSAGLSRDINLGTGKGYSVLEAIDAFKRASNRDIPFTIAPRRDGDIAEIYADPALAENLLGWRAEKSLDEMCADHWRWQFNNPNGYVSESDD